jgi:hypothetical protein
MTASPTAGNAYWVARSASDAIQAGRGRAHAVAQAESPTALAELDRYRS